MFHRSEKAIRYAKELDEARLNGHFHLVPNLARKLQKHDHHKQCVAKSALCEKTLYDMVAPLEKDQVDLVFEDDGPNRLILPPSVAPEKMQDVVNKMDEALTSPGTDDERKLAEVIAGQMWLAMGQWKKVLDKTEILASGKSAIDSQGYSYVLVLKAFTYNGIAYEGLKNFNSALHTYMRASEYISNSKPGTSYFSVQEWINKIMFRLCMLSLRLQSHAEAIGHFRRYKHLVDTQFKVKYGFRERLAAYYWYWRSLSELFKRRIEDVASENEKTSIDGEATTTGLQGFDALKEELSEMQNQYEAVLVDSTTFPHSGKLNQRILEFVDQAMTNWRLQGSNPGDAKNLVQLLYRTSTKTFHSPRIMRYLVCTLQASGNYVEAERALDAYLVLVETSKKTLPRGRNGHSTDSATGDNVQDIDSDEEILCTMASGIRLLVKYKRDGKKALSISQKLEKNAHVWNVTDSEVLGRGYHAIGMANSLWSLQTTEADSRQSLQSTAITAYTTALSHTPDSLETHYQLALQYAWQRNFEKSISSLTRALHIDKLHIPSIHLLALVLTALEDYEKALQTCHTVKLDHIEDLNIDSASALIELQLTYLRIVEVVCGMELALQIQKGVFKLYNRLFGTGPTVRPNSSITKDETDVDQRGIVTEHLRRTKSNATAEKQPMNSRTSLGKDSLDSKSSQQIPSSRVRRTRSFLKKKSRSQSVDGRSVETRSSSGEISEKVPNSSSSDIVHPPTHNVAESALPTLNRGIGDRKAATATQRLPNYASEVPSKYSSLPAQIRQQTAKFYRAKLWLACAGIYRRGHKWDGAQAAIEDALLCDVCPEEVFTELGELHFDRGAYSESLSNFERALFHAPNYPPAAIGLARTLLSSPQDANSESMRDRAEVYLDSITKSGGWDSSEAWFWLGEIYNRCFMPTKAAECWLYCEELEERKPIREWQCVKPEWL